MKFAFIAIAAVVVLGSVRVDGDVDIYPGIPEGSDDYSPLFPESLYSLPRMRGSFPWTRERKPTKVGHSGSASDDALSESYMRLLEDMLESQRQKFKVNGVKNFQYLSPHPEILDDPRPYVADEQDGDGRNIDADGDFSFLPADPPETDNLNDFGRPYEGRSRPEGGELYLQYPENEGMNAPGMMSYAYGNGFNRETDVGREMTSHEEHATHKLHEGMEGNGALPASASMSSKVFQSIEFVKDPADFAYPPSDPRFFEDSTKQETVGKPNVGNLNDIRTNKIYGSINTAPAYSNGPILNSGNLQAANANSDDYGFLTDDEGEGDEQIDDEVRDEQVHNFLRDKSINIKNRNDLNIERQGKEYLRNSEDVEVVAMRTDRTDSDSTGIYILAVIAGVSAAALVTLITLVITWFNLQKNVKNAADAEYPAYGVTGPNKEVSPSGDRRLAQSAQMYHYQHQKQQIIAMERAAATERHGSISEADSDEENEEGDYTVYECPGLAPTGEMEVKNPMFQDDPTPAQTPQQKQTDGTTPKK